VAAFSLSDPLSRCLIAVALVSFFSVTALAWGPERAPRRTDNRHVEWTDKRPVESTYKHRRREELDGDAAFHREYWQPCDSTFREYIVNACNAN
jgi:hypothetical protein